MRIAYVCDKKKKCKETPRCGDICNHTLFEEHAQYQEHGRFLIYGDKGQGFVLEELKHD